VVSRFVEIGQKINGEKKLPETTIKTIAATGGKGRGIRMFTKKNPDREMSREQSSNLGRKSGGLTGLSEKKGQGGKKSRKKARGQLRAGAGEGAGWG